MRSLTPFGGAAAAAAALEASVELGSHACGGCSCWAIIQTCRFNVFNVLNLGDEAVLAGMVIEQR